MSGRVTTVAIPVLQGAAELERLLPMIRGQALDGPLEMIVADSESTDGSAEVARRHGAEVIPVRRGEFSHGGTRNLLMERSHGELVAFLTQDALPAGDRWLAELTGAFSLRPDVGIAYGPGLPHRGASLTVRRELTAYFRSAAGEDALAPVVVTAESATMHGASSTTYFHSVNACVARAAWDEVPFRVIPYAEDRMLSLDVLRAGWAKAFVPTAAVVHSHDYRPLDLFRRSFDEWRGLREVTGHVEPHGIASGARWISGEVRADLEYAAEVDGGSTLTAARAVPASLRHACLRYAGAVLGSRANRLRPGARRRLSLERRATFLPQPPREPGGDRPRVNLPSTVTAS